MFDTERFISEIHLRECIWNANINAYGDRILRRQAWEEIGSVIYPDWDVYGGKTKNEAVQELQKKWKHLRDYFIRERNKPKQKKTPCGPIRKRKRPFLDMLEFLNLSKDSGYKISNVEQTSHSENSNNSSNTNEDNCDSLNTDNSMYLETSLHTDNTLQQSNTSKELSLFQEYLLKAINKHQLNNMNPHMNFLISLLPEMQTMSERQLFEFKLEIMNLLQRIKYSSDLLNGSGPSTSF